MTVTVSAAEGPRKGVRFSGYAALFDVADAGGDVIRKGAFRTALARIREDGEGLPLLWQHRPEAQIGWIEKISEDAKGLRVIARLSQADGTAGAMLREGAVRGLSFGYRAREAREIALPGGRPGRELNQIDLFEVSLVTHPMQEAARVIMMV